MKKLRKVYQRKFNKLVRDLNKNIEEDNLWKGRFVFRQTNASFYNFADGSGGILYVTIRGVDKKTGYYKDVAFEYAPYYTFARIQLWRFANNFIAQDSGIWKERPAITINNTKDFTKIKADESIWRKEANWYLDYAAWKE